jgi:hypothetical protein
MRSLTRGQRVKVVTAVRTDGVTPITLNAFGEVARVRTDGGAWVALDKRSHEPVHHFDATDSRGRNVLAYPTGCELATEPSGGGTRPQRRKNKRMAGEPEAVTVDMFGRDHWSTFGYLATRVLDHGGRPDNRHMRCDRNRHPFFAHPLDVLTGATPPTRLKDGELLNHDDWDCADDLGAAGLIENIGTAVNPVIRLTGVGLEVWKQLSAHKQDGQNFASFAPALAKTG